MNYFDNLPTLTYFFENVNEYVKLKNIFQRFEISFVNKDQLFLYRIDGNKRIDAISQDLYGTTEYWWLIALTNNIQDFIFDLPVDDDVLREIAKRETLDVYASLGDVGALDYYDLQLDSLIIENDNKRLLEVVSADQIGNVIAEITKRL